MYRFHEQPDYDYEYRPHVHRYSNETSVDVGHRHSMEGATGPAVRVGNSHIHFLCGSTSFNLGHRHLYTDYTGPAIYTDHDSHVHEYMGHVAHAGEPLHVHDYCARTGPAVYGHYY